MKPYIFEEARANGNEPVFSLRAKDNAAVRTLEKYIKSCQMLGEFNAEHLREQTDENVVQAIFVAPPNSTITSPNEGLPAVMKKYYISIWMNGQREQKQNHESVVMVQGESRIICPEYADDRF